MTALRTTNHAERGSLPPIPLRSADAHVRTLLLPRQVSIITIEPNFKKFKRKVPKTKILPMAAAFDEGTEEFKQTIRKSVEAITAARAFK